MTTRQPNPIGAVLREVHQAQRRQVAGPLRPETG